MDKVKEETECELYDNYECNAYYDIYPEPEDCQRDLCRTHEDCYYRQLKRLERQYEDILKLAKENADSNEFCIKELERENEELQEQLDKKFKLCSDCSTTHSFNLQISENKKLQAENERLKEENKELKSSLVRQASTIFTLEKSSNDLSQGTNKLYKALQEIREMATLFHSVNENKDLDRFKNNILAKINEVIGAE